MEQWAHLLPDLQTYCSHLLLTPPTCALHSWS